MIDGQTQMVGLIGWPVEHSLSPVMHNAAFDALGLNWRYVPLPVPPGHVEAAVRGLAALGFRGANVTVAHKQAVMATLDSIGDSAIKLGAVNTIVIGRADDGSTRLSGYNSDATGFAGALRMGGYEPEEGRRAVIVGAGGAARAVVFGLLGSGSGEIVVLNRTTQRAKALVSDLRGFSDQGFRLHTLPLTVETLVESVRSADLLVNATSVGLWPHMESSIWPESVPLPAHLTVFDLVYRPLETRLLRQARESGAHAINGLGMLVRQGAVAFELWTGEPAPVDVMRAACEQALGTA